MVETRTSFALTAAIGEFVAGLKFEAIPQKAVAIVRNGFTDCAATTILGRNEPVTRIVRAEFAGQTAAAEARLWFSRARTSGPEAALINGTAGHAHDYDDIGIGAHPAHPSVVLATAVLAEGETTRASGRDLITAYVAGYEVWAELAHRDARAHNVAGWHATGVFGAVAAAAAVARLRRLKSAEASRAVAIAASLASGLLANFGTMTKPLHAGRAAQSGILAARLAGRGLTAAPDAIENAFGFLLAYSPDGDVDLVSAPALGRDWWMLRHGLGFKLYPVCYANHRALDSMLDLVATHKFTAGDVELIEFEIGRNQAMNLVNHDPKSVLAAKFSGEFAMAMAVIAGQATMAELTEEFVAREDVRRLIKRVRLIELPGGNRPSEPPVDHVRVRLKDGRLIERRLGEPRGSPSRPLAGTELWTKFAACVAGAMADADTRALFDKLQALDRLAGIDDLPMVLDDGEGARR